MSELVPSKATEGPAMIDSPALPAEQVHVQASPRTDGRRFPVLPWPRVLPAVLTGVLLYLCYFPVACGWLAWVALVPLLCLVRVARPKGTGYPGERLRGPHGWLVRRLTHPGARLRMGAWLGGLVFFFPVLQWLRVADPRMYYTWAALAVYCSLYVPAGLLLVRLLDRRSRLPLVVTLPVVWTALEYFRSVFGGGFAWYLLGHTQHDFLPIIQVSDVTGAYGVTVLVAAVNALVFELLCKWRGFRTFFSLPEEAARWGRGALAAQATAVGLLLGGAAGYGAWRLSQDDFAPGPRVALIQGNVPQQLKNAASSAAGGDPTSHDAILDHYEQLTKQALLRQPWPDLLVWPETSYPEEWRELTADFHQKRSQLSEEDVQALDVNDQSKLNATILAEFSRCPSAVLLGLNSKVHGRGEQRTRYNSALLLQPGATALVDGYALRSADLATGIGSLRLVKVLPGVPGQLGANEALPIQRGSRLPAGADAVLWKGDNHRVVGDQLNVDDRIFNPDLVPSQPVLPGQNVVQAAGRYDKKHRVLFGEYVPFRDLIPFMDRLAPYDFDYSIAPGEQFTQFPIREAASGSLVHFGVIICFEDSDPALSREYVQEGDEKADFLVNISNDGWFDGTSEHEQHLAICRFRAIECRRSVARSVNMGISAVIDGNGRVLRPEVVRQEGQLGEWHIEDAGVELPVSRWGEFKKTAGVLTAVVPLDRRASLYAAWGDWLPWSCWGLLAVGLVGTVVRGRRQTEA